MNSRELEREKAARATLSEVVFLLNSDPDVRAYEGKSGEFDNAFFVQLLDKCFRVLDPDNNGISRTELTTALLSPDRFSRDEYVMVTLTAKYFDLIANMSDDQPGEETVITISDKETLAKLLLESNLNLAELHMWCLKRDKTVAKPESHMGPPPLAHES